MSLDFCQNLPPHLSDSPAVSALQLALQEETALLLVHVEKTLDQLFVSRADWGLALWEAAHGLPSIASSSSEARRNRILSKLHGQGTCTPAFLKALVSGFGFPSIEIWEHFALSRFEIVFLGLSDLPANLPDIAASVRENAPAHLDFFFSLQAAPFDASLILGGAFWTLTSCQLPPLF